MTTAGRAPLKAVALGWLALAASSAWAQTQAPAKGIVEGGRIAVKWTGDLDGMIKRRVIRVLVAYNKTHYFIDRGVQRGASYEAFTKFENELNLARKTGNLRVQVVFIPVSPRAMIELFRKYGDQYDLDWLLMTAQGYQESRLDQKVKSPVGAIGVMQVMPATGKDMKVGDIAQLDANIHAGIKYMRFMIDQYFKDEPMDRLNKGLFAFAYNAGPGRVRGLRQTAKARGLDPNLWFNNVERVAAEKIGRETVTYVSNIYKYYIAYKLTIEEMEEKKKALGS